MPIEFMTADQRLAEDHDKTTMAIFGRAKVGKTTLLTTLPEGDTLAVDMEAGFKSVLGWRGRSAKIAQDEDGSFKIQSEGSKTSNELPFIVDEIITLSDFDFPDGPNAPIHNFGKGQYRAFCCIQPNPWGLPAGDRSGKLNIVEEPHLGKLLDKINRR
jgi:hypothetical protein